MYVPGSMQSTPHSSSFQDDEEDRMLLSYCCVLLLWYYSTYIQYPYIHYRQRSPLVREPRTLHTTCRCGQQSKSPPSEVRPTVCDDCSESPRRIRTIGTYITHCSPKPHQHCDDKAERRSRKVGHGRQHVLRSAEIGCVKGQPDT
jgi:hypothetical protein